MARSAATTTRQEEQSVLSILYTPHPAGTAFPTRGVAESRAKQRLAAIVPPPPPRGIPQSKARAIARHDPTVGLPCTRSTYYVEPVEPVASTLHWYLLILRSAHVQAGFMTYPMGNDGIPHVVTSTKSHLRKPTLWLKLKPAGMRKRQPWVRWPKPFHSLPIENVD